MTQWAYLAVLLLGLGCMVLMDRRWRLVLWADARRGAAVLGTGVVMTGVQVAPELPLEEIFFILFLCYLTLVLHRSAQLLLRPRAAGEDSGS
jgi:hypothetical protein